MKEVPSNPIIFKSSGILSLSWWAIFIVRMAVKSSETKIPSGLWFIIVDFISISRRIVDRLLGILKIFPFGFWKEKPSTRNSVGESVLSFPVIIMVFWQPFFCKVLAASFPPSKLSEETMETLGAKFLSKATIGALTRS